MRGVAARLRGGGGCKAGGGWLQGWGGEVDARLGGGGGCKAGMGWVQGSGGVQGLVGGGVDCNASGFGTLVVNCGIAQMPLSLSRLDSHARSDMCARGDARGSLL